jgi:2-dehydro-3-deoxy-L-rhamnonate dehydrogenase (NAD+)
MAAGKTAIITGGAGAIASALAKRLMARGYRLILVDLDQDRLDASAAAPSAEVQTIRADLTVHTDVERVAALVEAEAGLALLVNNAGIIRPGNVVDLPYSELEKHISVNLLAPMRLAQAAARGMAARRGGCILSIVSAAALVALPGSAAYSASKFGLRGFLIALSQELAGSGVKVRGVFPCAVDTPMLRYEAAHGGSALNFLNKDVLSVDQVAEACLRAIDGKALETYLPFGDGLSGRIVCALPGLIPRLLPHLQKQGEKGLQRFLASRGLTAANR